MKRKLFFILLLLGVVGVMDSSYLAYEHYTNLILPCTINHLVPFLSDCGLVLRSKYAILFGIPLAVLGLIHYTVLTLVIGLALTSRKKIWLSWLFLQVLIGAVFSMYFMYLQIVVIKNICIYCTLSALNSFALFMLSNFWLVNERKAVAVYFMSIVYRYVIKRIFFLINPELIHKCMLAYGEFLGKFPWKKRIVGFFLYYGNPHLRQKILDIEFPNPVGLAAGFDYNAQLTQVLSSIGFGFQTVGTITNMPYGGNPKPMLGRLPKSKALMVNKGFKNFGVKYIVEKLQPLSYLIPLGISVGRTNSPDLKNQGQSVEDIVKAFEKLEKSNIQNAYYELNISCPNLIHGKDISFYPSKNLLELLGALKKLNIKKPVFVKMPIEKSNKETLKILQVMGNFTFIRGVVIGNLQKDRTDPSLDREEIKKWKMGGFSGKPCEQRSNELVKLTYQNFEKRFVIIGCGGIFSAADAYRKFKLGASLVQLITGMIYQGPQLISQINSELVDMLDKDGFKNISEAIGTGV